MNWQRPLAVLLLVMVVASLGMAGWVANGWIQEQKTTMAESLSGYDRLRAIAAFDPKSLGDGKFNAITDGKLLGAESAPILSAQLQSTLRALASQKNLVIGQASEIPPAELGSGLMKAGTRMEFSGQQQAVLEFFQMIGEQSPWLFVDAVEVRSGSAYEAAQSQEMPVTAVAEIWGIYLGAAASQATGQGTAPP